MSGGPPRKVPRIMSRVKQKSDGNREKLNNENSKLQRDALSLELSREKLVVRDGVVVAVQQLEKNGIVSGVLGASGTSGGRRVIIDTGHISMRDIETYTENPLPGCADEVESYPCILCTDLVFLTSFGLERHARADHREKFTEITAHIKRIQDEWARRERQRSEQRERAQLAKIRQESIAQAAIRNASLRMHAGRLGHDLDISQEINIPEHPGPPERFEACRICNRLVNSRHPTAMENHLRAHKKNDELRSQMLAELGTEIVTKLTCHECQLVFTDESKLLVHYETNHVRRRKFVCKWCGHLCASMTELNMHKADVHAMPSNQSRAERMQQIQQIRAKQSQLRPRSQSQLGSTHFRRIDGNHSRPRNGMDDAVCRTTCDECGLKLVRPSLLIRHMLRVHSKETFSCEIETSGLPAFKIDVSGGRVTWMCCDTEYNDRQNFLLHRGEHLDASNASSNVQELHLEKEEHSGSDRILQLATNSANIPLQPGSSSYTGQLVQAEDGSMQVVLPEGVDTSGELYVVVMDDDDEKRTVLYDQPGTSRQGQRHHVIHASSIVETDGDQVTLTQEQYDQLRAQYGDDLSNMHIMFVSDEDMANGEVLEDEMLQQTEQASHDLRHSNLAQTHLLHHHPDLTNEEIFEP